MKQRKLYAIVVKSTGDLCIATGGGLMVYILKLDAEIVLKHLREIGSYTSKNFPYRIDTFVC
jgi:hypothetical protein